MVSCIYCVTGSGPVVRMSSGEFRCAAAAAAATVLLLLPRDTHSSDVLKYLHWLPIEQRIRFELATLTHNSLSSIQPAYRHFLLHYYTHTRCLYALQAPTCCLLLVFTLPLSPVVLVLQPPQSGTHSHLAFSTLPLPYLLSPS